MKKWTTNLNIHKRKRIRNTYKSRAEEDSNRIKIVDSSVSFKEVKAQVVYIISQFLNE